MVSSWTTPKALKGTDSAIAGRGLVALDAIARDEVVAVKGGHITSAALQELPERLQNSDVQITDELHRSVQADQRHLTPDQWRPEHVGVDHDRLSARARPPIAARKASASSSVSPSISISSIEPSGSAPISSSSRP